MNSINCPVCHTENLVSSIFRSKIPAMQNYLYRTRDVALNSPFGEFELMTCARCGFSFNTKFDSTRLSYDTNYDNSVPSQVMILYYRQIASYLYKKYNLSGHLIIDIGCGKGTFLNTMAEMYSDVMCLGIDPSYDGDLSPSPRLNFICDIFKREYILEKPGLVVCRHVLEHIPAPIDFLGSINSALIENPNTPCFFEIPNLWWVLEHKAFWDFCYEHCNYFTPDSFAHALAVSGFGVTMSQTQFGDQYIWMESLSGITTALIQRNVVELVNKIENYNSEENIIINKVRQTIKEKKNNGSQVAVWGMATKGILYTFLIDPSGVNIDYCIDANTTKQGCFTPLTGHQIQSPSALQAATGMVTVIVMNPNYAAEIEEMVNRLGISFSLMDAFGNIL